MEKPGNTKSSKRTDHAKAEEDMQATQAENLGTAPADGSEEPDGTTLGGVLMLRQVAPKEWCKEHVGIKPKGYEQSVGRVVGQCTGYFQREGTLPDGKKKISTALTGAFGLQSLVTGEIIEGHTIYLPDNVALRVKGSIDMLAADGEEHPRVIMDIDIICRATGEMISYEWKAVSYVKDKGTELMRAMLNRRRPVVIGNAPAPKLIEG